MADASILHFHEEIVKTHPVKNYWFDTLKESFLKVLYWLESVTCNFHYGFVYSSYKFATYSCAPLHMSAGFKPKMIIMLWKYTQYVSQEHWPEARLV